MENERDECIGSFSILLCDEIEREGDIVGRAALSPPQFAGNGDIKWIMLRFRQNAAETLLKI